MSETYHGRRREGIKKGLDEKCMIDYLSKPDSTQNGPVFVIFGTFVKNR